MARFIPVVLSSSLLAFAAAQSPSSSVISVFLPLADQQPLVASIVGGDSAATTLVMQCAPSADPADCGFPSPITFTAGPSTLHLNPSGIYEALGELDCKITGNTEATCGLTAGIYDTQATATGTDYITTPAASSSTQTAIASGTEFSDALITITITAGEVSGGSGTSATEVGTSTSEATTSRSQSGSATGTLSSTTASATGNAAGRLSGFVGSAAVAGLLTIRMLLS